MIPGLTEAVDLTMVAVLSRRAAVAGMCVAELGLAGRIWYSRMNHRASMRDQERVNLFMGIEKPRNIEEYGP